MKKLIIFSVMLLLFTDQAVAQNPQSPQHPYHGLFSSPNIRSHPGVLSQFNPQGWHAKPTISQQYRLLAEAYFETYLNSYGNDSSRYFWSGSNQWVPAIIPDIISFTNPHASIPTDY